MTTPNDDLDLVLLLAGHLPDTATSDVYTIADTMLRQANGNHQLAAQFFRIYIDTIHTIRNQP